MDFLSFPSILLPDVTKDPRYVVGNPTVRSKLAVPLFDEGNVVGVIDLDSDVPDNFHTDDRELVQTFAGVAPVALRNARLFAERVKPEGERNTTNGGKKT